MSNSIPTQTEISVYPISLPTEIAEKLKEFNKLEDELYYALLGHIKKLVQLYGPVITLDDKRDDYKEFATAEVFNPKDGSYENSAIQSLIGLPNVKMGVRVRLMTECGQIVDLDNLNVYDLGLLARALENNIIRLGREPLSEKLGFEIPECE